MPASKKTTLNNYLKTKHSGFSRRQFVKLGLWAAAISQIPFGASCEQAYKSESVAFSFSKDYHLDMKAVRAVQSILLPKDETGPGALELKAPEYLLWVLSDPRRNPRDNEYILKGFAKLEQQALYNFNKNFGRLTGKEQEDLIGRMSLTDWAANWLSTLLTFIFEAMFANPNYGSNPDGIGWKWLQHQAGMPQPAKEQIYPLILEQNRALYSKAST
jgi:gluconate 2-dehydrogenase gamma chain